MRALPLAAALLTSAATLTAQPPAPPLPERAPEPGHREFERDRMSRPFGNGPARVRGFYFGFDQEERRSVIGVLLGEADASGLRIARVTPDAPAARAGLEAGDQLVAVNGASLRVDRADVGDPLLAAVPARRLERAVGRLAPGSEVELRYVRDGRERAVRVRTVAPTALADGGPGAWRAPRGPDRGPDRDGGEFRTFNSAVARPVLGLTLGGTGSVRDTLGLFVSAVAPGGPAERAGVVEGDRVAALGSVDVRVPREERDTPEAADARRARFTRELGRLRPGDQVTLRLWSDGRWRTVTATVGRSGDVYRGAAAFGLNGPVLSEGFRSDLLRFAPPGALAPDGVPEVRRFRTPQHLRAPLPPLPPEAPRRWRMDDDAPMRRVLPRLARTPRRLVDI